MENKIGKSIVSGYLLLFGGGLLFVICLATCNSSSTPEEKAKRVEYSRQLDAYSYAQEFIKKRLPAPNTADFPAMQEAIIKDCNNNDMYWVEGYFDAQNRYGAIVRWKYHCMVHLERGQAEASEIEVIEP